MVEGIKTIPIQVTTDEHQELSVKKDALGLTWDSFAVIAMRAYPAGD